jgi:hypothetical protein
MKDFAKLVKAKLENRTTEFLKRDVIEAQKSEQHGSTIVFVAALEILESRLSKEEYEQFEASL